MNKPQKQLLINENNLRADSYFQSILSEAGRWQLLSEIELENIHLQLLALLTQRLKKYTHGESNSVRTEIGESILQSVLYSISIYLKDLPDADFALEAIKKRPLAELYQEGQKLILLKIDQAKQLLIKVKDNRLIQYGCGINNCLDNNNLGVNNQAYDETIEKGIASFFFSYDAGFAAHETPGSIDYPLCGAQTELTGIEYILNYLETLCLENDFCQRFKTKDIHYLLMGYDGDYPELLINIFELTLNNALGCVLADKDPLELNMTGSDRQYLKQKLLDLAADRLAEILNEASFKLIKTLNIGDACLQKHIMKAVMDLNARLSEALAEDQLAALFISFGEIPDEPPLKYLDGKKMSDGSFRKISAEIRSCRFLEDKIAIIRQDIHSIGDLVDILEGDCLFADEYIGLFQSLGDMELALLLRKMPPRIIDSDLHFTENEKQWHDKFKAFLAQTGKERKEYITELAKQISISEE